MSIELLSILFVVVFVVILLAGVPLAFATGAVAVVFAYALFGLPGLTLVISRVFTLMGNYVLVSVPLFIFMACILERAGVADAIFRAVHVWFGGVPGGLAVAVIFSCALMATMVGVIGAEIVTMGVIALPAMLEPRLRQAHRARQHLRRRRPGDADSAERRLHPLRPDRRRLDRPALHGRRHAGAAARRLLLRLHHRPLLDLARARAAGAARGAAACRCARRSRMLGELILPGLVALRVLGSLYLGMATPTEAAGVGVVGAVLAMSSNGRLSWAACATPSRRRPRSRSMLYWLFFGSSALIGVYTLAGGTRLIQDTMTSLPLEPIYIIIMIQIIWIILGCFIDWIGILFLTAPIFVPIAEKLGFDLVWLGVLFCLNMQISYISPPFGPAAFYLKGVTPPGITLSHIFGSIWPYLVLQIIVLGLVMAFPQIALWLPSTMAR